MAFPSQYRQNTALIRRLCFAVISRRHLTHITFVSCMSTAIEVENAIRLLPVTEARAVAHWLQEYLFNELSPRAPIAAEAIAKWRGRGRLPAGRNADEYLHMTRDGNGC